MIETIETSVSAPQPMPADPAGSPVQRQIRRRFPSPTCRKWTNTTNKAADSFPQKYIGRFAEFLPDARWAFRPSVRWHDPIN